MEYYDQGFGSILYRTALPEISIPSTLKIDEAHDYAQIFINDRLIGCIDRRKGESEILIPQCQSGDRLDILVEAMGRINFGRAIKDYKGITNKVVVLLNKDNTEVIELKKWEIYNIKDELDYYKSMAYDKINSLTDSLGQRIPGCYRATFNVNKPGDTFLNLETWGKGLVYVNGHPLGRFWSIGPQQTLYMPGCWLKEGENEIVVFDIIGPKEVIVEGLDSPIINKLNLEESKSRKIVNLNDCELVSSGEFKSGNGWQCAKFASRVEGQVITIEILNSHNSKNQAAIAEIYLIDKDGNRLSREGWTVLNASSEDVEGVNHTAEKIFDLQESTYWMSDPEDKFPHTITIDLGRTSVVTGIEYLPRMENDAPASVKEYKVYLHN